LVVTCWDEDKMPLQRYPLVPEAMNVLVEARDVSV
jgi:hypothetical protein